jgi:hypothetical protein
MRKTATFLVISFFSFLASTGLSAQGGAEGDNGSNPSHFRNPVWFGLNIGPSWQTSNVPVGQIGVGGGLTLGKNYLTYTPSKVFIGWRFRYLSANTYGQDFSRNYGIKNNVALNGTADTSMNYAKNGGYVYNNYKMTLNELSLEVLFGPNLIHKRTGSGLLAYIFGGAGLVQTTTMLNMRGANDSLYNFSRVDPNGKATSTQISSGLSAIQDNTYETAADGSARPSWHFMPSLGIGLGYQFKNVFQIGAEFKTTFALNVPIDGILWNNDNTPKALNDRYNYGGFFIKFGFGGGNHNSGTGAGGTTTSTGYTGGDHTVHTDYTPPTPPSGVKPAIVITYPSVNPSNSSHAGAQMTAHIEYVSFSNEVSLTLNGVSISTWHFNPSNGMLNSDFTLLPGNNVLTLSANNAYGNSYVSQYFNYTPLPVNIPAQPPVVNITSPTGSPVNSSIASIHVTAYVTGVDYPNELHVKINGITTGNFLFDPSTKTLSFDAPLSEGGNYIYIRATNTAGADSKSLTAFYTIPPASGPPVLKPVVTLSSSMSNPFYVNTAAVTVYATVDNVFAASQIQLMINSTASQNFTFEPATHQLQFTATVNQGVNYVYIRAFNQAGSDSKNLEIVYTLPAAVVPAPAVNILNPNISPLVTSSSSAIVLARVDNITDKNEITVHVNGMNFTNFVYSLSSHNVEFNVPLVFGSNSVYIAASNVSGTDSKNVQIVYSVPQVARPAITILSPGSNPYMTSSPSLIFKALVTNVTSQNDIHLTVNGAANTTFTYNAAAQILELTSNLLTGNNYFNITASNASGSDNKSVEVVYTPSLPKPEVIIKSPIGNPFQTSTGTLTVVANVNNIGSRNDIHVTVNGSNTPNFMYNPVTRVLEFTASLNTGNNNLQVSATTGGGSDSKNLSVVYSPLTVSKPLITLISPSNSPFPTNLNNTNVTASVVNVNGQGDIQVSRNGATVNFTYNPSTHMLQFTSALNPGNNNFDLLARTSAGSDAKSLNVVYTEPLPAPVITITNPHRNPEMMTGGTFTVEAAVTNINSRNQVQVIVNGQNTGSFSFIPEPGTLTITGALNRGRNSIQIMASNSSGSDSKTQEIMFTPTLTGSGAGTPRPKPIVDLTPAPNGGNLTTASYTLMGKVQYVSNNMDIHVTQNNNPVTGFSFDPVSQNLQVPVQLAPGSNMFTVTGLNANGSDSKSQSVTYTAPPAPLMSLIRNAPQLAPGQFESVIYPISGKIIGINSAADIKVSVNGVKMTSGITYNPVDHSFNIMPKEVGGVNTIEIIATNPSGSTKRVLTVNYEAR